jgi:Tfp pilus assembly protein PilN
VKKSHTIPILPPPGGPEGGFISPPRRATSNPPPSGGTRGGLFNPFSLRISYSATTSGHRFMVVSKSKKGKWSVIYSGTTLPWYYKYLIPLVVNIDAGSIPFVINAVNSDPSDSDSDANLPGFPPENIHSIQSCINNQCVSATTTDKSIKTVLGTVPPECIVQSIKPPLWDLATLYSQYIPSPFILWKLNNRDSTACYIENGSITKSLTCWIGSDDINENSSDTVNEIENYFKSISVPGNLAPVIFYPERPSIGSLEKKQFTILDPPIIEGVSTPEHELYAIATADIKQMNVLPYQQAVKVKNILKTWKFAQTVTRWILTAVTCLLLVILSSVLFQKISQHYMSTSLHELHTLRKSYTLEKNRFDSLKNVFRKNAQHIQKESVITTLLNDIQNVFPEGMWAEEITIVESDKSMWKLTIRALSNSSELLSTFNNNLKKVRGTSNHRIIYSENTTLKNKPSSIIRTKVECNWNFQTP